jgi:hypothetical protein
MQTRAQSEVLWKLTGWNGHLEDLSLRVALHRHYLAVQTLLQLETWGSTLGVAASISLLQIICILSICTIAIYLYMPFWLLNESATFFALH